MPCKPWTPEYCAMQTACATDRQNYDASRSSPHRSLDNCVPLANLKVLQTVEHPPVSILYQQHYCTTVHLLNHGVQHSFVKDLVLNIVTTYHIYSHNLHPLHPLQKQKEAWFSGFFSPTNALHIPLTRAAHRRVSQWQTRQNNLIKKKWRSSDRLS